MKCRRCKGLMVYECYYSDTGKWCGHRCLFCGEVIDPVVLENRREGSIRPVKYNVKRRDKINENELDFLHSNEGGHEEL